MTKAGMEAVDGLDDKIFVQGADLAADLARAMEGALGRKPTLAEFLRLLVKSLQSINRDLFADSSPNAVKELVPRLAKRSGKLLPSTLLAVPVKEGWRFVVYLASNRFGDALGILSGSGSVATDEASISGPVGKPVYSSLRSVREGRWKIVGSRPGLSSLFQPEPEIYHAKTGLNVDNAEIGTFGSAESPDGHLRKLDQAEAKAVGLLDGTYRQVRQPEEVEQYLRQVRW